MVKKHKNYYHFTSTQITVELFTSCSIKLSLLYWISCLTNSGFRGNVSLTVDVHVCSCALLQGEETTRATLQASCKKHEADRGERAARSMSACTIYHLRNMLYTLTHTYMMQTGSAPQPIIHLLPRYTHIDVNRVMKAGCAETGGDSLASAAAEEMNGWAANCLHS